MKTAVEMMHVGADILHVGAMAMETMGVGARLPRPYIHPTNRPTNRPNDRPNNRPHTPIRTHHWAR